MRTRLHAFAAGIGLAMASFAQTVPQGSIARTYVQIPDPVGLAFNDQGFLFVGNDLSGSGGNPKGFAKIRIVQTGGILWDEYGDAAIRDPDAVWIDQTGVITGVPHAILVGGIGDSNNLGQVSVVNTMQQVSTLWGPSASFVDPNDFALDSQSRLLFTDNGTTGSSGRVMVYDPAAGGQPVQLFAASPAPYSIAVDPIDRIWTSASTAGVIRIYTSTGTLINGNWVTYSGTASPMAWGSGVGIWSQNLYLLANGSHELIEVDLAGNKTVRGTGFPPNIKDLAFGPDGHLYLSSFDEDRIIVVEPCYANCDGSPGIDLFDFLCFVNAFNLNQAYADCDGNQVRDLFDFLCFTNKFTAGCPE
jgi:hypothetical protein